MNSPRKRFIELAVNALACLLPAVHQNVIAPTDDASEDTTWALESVTEQIMEYLERVTRAKNVKGLLVQAADDSEYATPLMTGLVSSAIALTKVTASQVSLK